MLVGHDNYIATSFVEKGHDVIAVVSGDLQLIDLKGIDRFDFEDVKYAEYTGINWGNVRPLSKSFLQEMAYCETQFLRMADRLYGNPSYSKRKAHYLRHLRFWNSYLEDKKIEAVLFFSSPHEGFDFVIYALCKHNAIKTLYSSPLPMRPKKCTALYLSSDIDSAGLSIYEKYLEICEALKYEYPVIDDIAKPVRYYIEELDKGSENIIPYTLHDAFSFRASVRKYYSFVVQVKFKRYYSALLKLINCIRRFDLGEIRKAILINYPMDEYFEGKQYLNKYYDHLSVKADIKNKYVYFPLHYQPEASTSPLAGAYVDQELICQMISYCLPKGWYLYVKDHPRVSRSFLRSKSFYDSIASLSNVKIIDRHANTFELTENAQAVATVSGSAGFEAFLRNIPVLSFGSNFYQYAPGVFRVCNESDCKQAIDSILDGNKASNKKDVIRYLIAVSHYAIEYEFHDLHDASISNIDLNTAMKNLSNALYEALGDLDN